MTAAGQVLASLLRRAALLAGVLAVIAGIFGMHVMTASHASHAGAGHTHASTAHASTTHSSTAHASTTHSSGLGHPAAGAVVVLSAGAVCAETCPGAEEAGASCVPSAAAGSFSVVAPPAPVMQQGPAGAAVVPAGYSYLPSGPTPCELSISRT